MVFAEILWKPLKCPRLSFKSKCLGLSQWQNICSGHCYTAQVASRPTALITQRVHFTATIIQGQNFSWIVRQHHYTNPWSNLLNINPCPGTSGWRAEEGKDWVQNDPSVCCLPHLYSKWHHRDPRSRGFLKEPAELFGCSWQELFRLRP